MCKGVHLDTIDACIGTTCNQDHHLLTQVVLAAEGEDLQVYRRVLPLYFPRDSAEAEWAVSRLPRDCGSAEDGEPAVPERQIGISGRLGSSSAEIAEVLSSA